MRRAGWLSPRIPFFWRRAGFPMASRHALGAGAATRRVPFDALEVNDAFPGLTLANLRLRRANARYRRLPLVGNSESHVKKAIGRSDTRFPGGIAPDLITAIRRCPSTSAMLIQQQ